MKMAMTALAVVFLAAAGSAIAAPGDGGQRERGDRSARSERPDRPRMDGAGRGGEHRGGGGGGERWRGGGPRFRDSAAQAPEAPRAPQAPRAVEPRAPGQAMPGRDRDWATPEQRRAARTDDGPRGGDRRQPDRRAWDHRGDTPPAGAPPARADNDRRGDRGDGRGRGDRRDGDQVGRGDRRGGDRNDWRGRDGDRGEWRGRDGDRGGRYDHDRRGDRRHWERGRYPGVYFSSHRYRHSWRPPAGYYVRLWGFGDFLPRGWYAPEYYINDPWNYDLPLAPPGFDWVRTGYDALLVDNYSGQVVQVVRNVFW